MRVAILGNSGSGKSTLAGRLAVHCGGPVLGLDTVAWEPDQVAVARPEARARADVIAFCEARDHWVLEGCHGNLVGATLAFEPTLLFLDPGVDECLSNCRARPWEPHKYPSRRQQDERLAFLLAWVREYYVRDEDPALSAHQALFESYAGPKQRLCERPPPEFVPPTSRTSADIDDGTRGPVLRAEPPGKNGHE